MAETSKMWEEGERRKAGICHLTLESIVLQK